MQLKGYARVLEEGVHRRKIKVRQVGVDADEDGEEEGAEGVRGAIRNG
jgi:hypothetical protein